MSLSLPSEGQSNWDEPLNAALTALDTRVDAALAEAEAASGDALDALSRANHTGTQSADTITDGVTNKAYTATEKTKLAGIAVEATNNSADVVLLARANHTGTQPASTISDFDAAVDARIATVTRSPVTINAQTGTSYTLVLADAGSFVTMTNALASTLTVPSNADVAFPVGTLIEGAQLGAGQVTLTPGPGVTINGAPGLLVAEQYGTFGLLKVDTNTWLPFGRLSA